MAVNNDVGYSSNLVKNLRVIIDTVVKNIQRKPSKKSRKEKKNGTTMCSVTEGGCLKHSDNYITKEN